MSRVTCPVSNVTCHVSGVTIFFTKLLSLSVEGLLSTGPLYREMNWKESTNFLPTISALSQILREEKISQRIESQFLYT